MIAQFIEVIPRGKDHQDFVQEKKANVDAYDKRHHDKSKLTIKKIDCSNGSICKD